ncbi:MAG: hypothetical protein LBQ54_15085 [Planctomycetaceae bacterium]|jgi:hypothetical protein|nr:hypothetical protein [Planctomycetaceae bacterium]
MNFFQSFYITHFSKPVCDRVIFRHIQADRPQKILEIGIQRAVRTLNLLQLAIRYCGELSDIHYTAIDPFEARTQADGPGLSLRKAHRLISQWGVRSRLCPLPPELAVKQLFLDRVIEKVDLVVVAMPSLDWFSVCAPHLSGLIHESAGIFVGIPCATPAEPFTFEKFNFTDFEQILHDPELLQRRLQRAA